MPHALVSQIQTVIASFGERVAGRLQDWTQLRDAAAMTRMEFDVAALARSLADSIAELVVRSVIEDTTFQQETTQAARRWGRYRGGEKRPVTVTLLGGRTFTLKSTYLKPNRRGLVGRPRGVGRRGKGGYGLFPALAALGIAFGVSPALANEICNEVTAGDSVRSARQTLGRRGIDLGHKQTLRVVNTISRSAIRQREQWMQHALSAPATGGFLSGRRVVIGTDGGRIRERVPAKAGRRRKDTGHRRYQTPWREPKLIVIYVIDDAGVVDSEVRPIYDGTMGNCDETFRLLTGYLRQLGIHEAKELIIVGDGAKWIWDRCSSLVVDIGIDAAMVTEVVDWYHAVQTLHTIADARSSWAEGERSVWLRKARRLLHKGEIDALDRHIRTLARGRRAEAVSKHIDYFVRNADRMQYATFKKRKIPCGSGAIESTVRRVVNMRMKANGTFWLERNAEGMLMLRSYLKSNRFNDLINWVVSAASPWWAPHSNTLAPAVAA